jgi:hypothetical protein
MSIQPSMGQKTQFMVLIPGALDSDFGTISMSELAFCYRQFRFHLRRPEAWETCMGIQEQIKAYVATQPEQKRSQMEQLHEIILVMMPKCKLWFLDGKDERGKVVSNPNIGYGTQKLKHANGKTREFFQIGLSANTTGISVYIMGLDDRQYLARTFGKKLGKASATGYCIKFKTLADINVEVLKAAIQYGVEQTNFQR